MRAIMREILSALRAPILGLAFVVFLPLLGFLALGAVALEALGFGRLLWPMWTPGLAYFAKRKDDV